MGYLSNFIVYFFAMIGIIILALYVYKKFNVGSIGVKKSGHLKIEDCMNLTARKTLYVVREGNERFLIAADTDRTTLISKLADSDVEDVQAVVPIRNSRMIKKVDLSERGIQAQDEVAPSGRPIMKEIKNRLRF